MRETYMNFIAQHETIERAADRVLAGAGQAAPADLSARLCTLADLVHRHIAAEDGVVQRMDRPTLPTALAEPWQRGRADFMTLRTDWLLFVDRWTRAAIAADKSGFIAAAHATLTSLKQATHIETRAFYAAALQDGALAFGHPAPSGAWPNA